MMISLIQLGVVNRTSKPLVWLWSYRLVSTAKENGEVIALTEKSELNLTERQPVNFDKFLTKRDVSRMPAKYRNRMRHVMIPPDAPDGIAALRQKLFMKQNLYGVFGRKSGIDAGYLWPSEEKLSEMVEFEKEWEPSLHQMWEKLQQESAAEAKERHEKNELVAKQMAKMPQLVNKYREKLVEAEELQRQRKKQQQELLEEVRDYFGYNLPPSDPRFEQFKLEKEEREKTMKKKRKKEEKLAKITKLLKT